MKQLDFTQETIFGILGYESKEDMTEHGTVKEKALASLLLILLNNDTIFITMTTTLSAIVDSDIVSTKDVANYLWKLDDKTLISLAGDLLGNLELKDIL